MASPAVNVELTPAELSRFRPNVRNVVLDLVNNHHVGWRQPDGNHFLLYNGDRKTRPFKLAASRPEEDTLRYLLPWVVENVDTWPKTTEPTPESEDHITWYVYSKGTPRERTSEWLYWKDGVITCIVDGCGYTSPNGTGVHLHEAKHNGKAAEAGHKGGLARQQAKAQRKTQEAARTAEARDAVLLLAQHYGIRTNEEKNAALTAENAALKAEVSELQAKIALIREATGL